MKRDSYWDGHHDGLYGNENNSARDRSPVSPYGIGYDNGKNLSDMFDGMQQMDEREAKFNLEMEQFYKEISINSSLPLEPDAPSSWYTDKVKKQFTEIIVVVCLIAVGALLGLGIGLLASL